MSDEDLYRELKAMATRGARLEAEQTEFTRARHQLVIKSVAAGMPKREVARRIGLSRDSIYRILESASAVSTPGEDGSE